MSEEAKLEPSCLIAADNFTAEDLTLQIRVRLHLDEVAEVEARPVLPPQRQPSDKDLCELACQLYDARRARDRMLDLSVFGEPAWDMLLALYCLPTRGERLGVTALSLAGCASQSTGHRWQANLLALGLIERVRDPGDARREFVQLTRNGRKRLDRYLRYLFNGERAARARIRAAAPAQP